MNVNEMFMSHLKEHYGSRDNILRLIKYNALYFPTAQLFDIDIEKEISYKLNRLRYEYVLKMFSEIKDLFSTLNINAFLFKGVALAKRLYDTPYKRYIGDIDIFVDKEKFSAALSVLIRLGYNFRDEKTFYNEHHIVLVRDNVTVELHRSIYNPILGINEGYLLKHLVSIPISQCEVQTFDITATLLHLIYHLYQDTYWSHYSLHSVLTSAKIPTTKRFLYRAYEIALFAEKYYKEVKWDDIVNDLKHQKLRVFFKKMIYDFVAIFPNVFPDDYLKLVDNMPYIEDEHDVWYRRLLDSECSQRDISFILSDFIDQYWNKRATQNICIKAGESFTLNKPYFKDQEDDTYELTCNVSTEKANGDLKLTFKVSDNDFSFTAVDNFDTTTSDGVHLMLFGTEKYSYNSIYIFPKIINGKAMAIPVDVKRGERTVIDPSLISTNCECTDKDYTITVTLTNKFLQENNLSKYLYMGLIIVDCSPETRKRKAELVLADTYSEWYNPTYFAKVDIT